MSRILTPDQLNKELDDLWSAIRSMKTAPSLNNSEIREGAVLIRDGAGVTRDILGKDPADGTYGVKIYDANGRPLLTNDGGTVVDGSAVTRFKWGKLDSVPNYGIQVFDSTGAVILDTTGLQQAVKEIATFDVNPQNQTLNLTGVANIFDITTVTSGSFTLARAADVLILNYLTARISAGASFAYSQFVLKSGSTDVAGPYYNGLWDSRNAGYVSFGGWASIVPLAAGTYTAVFQGYGDNLVTFAVYSGHGSVFLLGK